MGQLFNHAEKTTHQRFAAKADERRKKQDT